jgi:hypothetical protein
MFEDRTKRMTAKEYAAFAARPMPPVDTSSPPFALPPDPQGAKKAGLFALGRLKTGEMNGTEAAYAEHLAGQQRALEVLWFKFEGLKLRLADNTFYSPDFVVMTGAYALECHEVKGFWTDDARVKIKVAASIFPFRFVAVTKRAKKNGGGWAVEEF